MMESKPIDKLDDLIKKIEKYKYKVSEYCYDVYGKGILEECTLTIFNPFSSINLIIEIRFGEFLLFFGEHHEHFYNWDGEYERLINFLQSFFDNDICFSELCYGNTNLKCLSQTIITKNESIQLELRKHFLHTFDIPEHNKKLEMYGGMVFCTFWNPKDDINMKILPKNYK